MVADFRLLIGGASLQWRESLTTAFRAGSTGEVIAHEDSRLIVSTASRLFPDVILWKIDIDKPDIVVGELSSHCPFSLPIVIVDNPNLCNIPQLIKAGVKGCLPGRLLPIQIVHAVELIVHAGLLCLPRMGPELLFAPNQQSNELFKLLTPREIQILQLLSQQSSNQEIADSLYISVSTIKTHLRNIYRKLDLRNRNEAMSFAINSGLATLNHSTPD